MAQVNNKTTYTKSMRISTQVSGIVPSVYVPTPNIVVTGTSTAFTATTITDTTKDFTTLNIKVGDLISNPTNGLNSLITGITATQITFSVSNIFSATGAYNILSQTDPGSVAAYSGFVLYNCTSSVALAITATTLDGYAITLTLGAGVVCPIQLSAVTNNTNSYATLIALW
jgi:hypothetical protein